MSYSETYLDFSLSLATESFGDGNNHVKLSGLRATADITHTGSLTPGGASAMIWGVPLPITAQMTLLSTIAQQNVANNVLTIEAGTAETGAAVCFIGTIKEAWADASSPGEIKFYVSAFTNLLSGLNPIPPASYNGTVDVAVVMAGIASQMGLVLSNNGVTGTIENPYLCGSAKQQLATMREAAHIMAVPDQTTGKLNIWPAGAVAENDKAIVISAATGMVGYPSFSQNGIQVTLPFNPTISFMDTVEVRSTLEYANGQWQVGNVTHNLSSQMPGGPRFTTLDLAQIGHLLPNYGSG